MGAADIAARLEISGTGVTFAGMDVVTSPYLPPKTAIVVDRDAALGREISWHRGDVLADVRTAQRWIAEQKYHYRPGAMVKVTRI